MTKIKLRKLVSMNISFDGDLSLELKRKSLHVLGGTISLLLVYFYGVRPLQYLVIFALVSGIMLSLLMSRFRHQVFDFILDHFERDENRELPLRDTLVFVLAIGISTLLVDRTGLYAVILLMAVGDTVSNLAGRTIGRTTNPFNPEKEIEGGITAIIVSSVLISLFMPIHEALIISTASMFIESLRIEISGVKIDDNFTVPATAIIVYSILSTVP